MSDTPRTRTLILSGEERYDFVPVKLALTGTFYDNVFAEKNNKTLAETLDHRRYANLSDVVVPKYSPDLDMPLGSFLLKLKQDDDPVYRRFLNKYGDLTYSNFAISDERYFDAKGIYAYYVGDALKYVGRCRDTMKKRVNQGYGKIHPKNCYRDGQATNCHLNALVAEVGPAISLWLFPMKSDDEIVRIESDLIQKYQPPWNIQRA